MTGQSSSHESTTVEAAGDGGSLLPPELSNISFLTPPVFSTGNKRYGAQGSAGLSRQTSVLTDTRRNMHLDEFGKWYTT